MAPNRAVEPFIVVTPTPAPTGAVLSASTAAPIIDRQVASPSGVAEVPPSTPAPTPTAEPTVVTVNELQCPAANVVHNGGWPSCFRPNDGDEIVVCERVGSDTEWHTYAQDWDLYANARNMGCRAGDNAAKIDPDAARP